MLEIQKQENNLILLNLKGVKMLEIQKQENNLILLNLKGVKMLEIQKQENNLILLNFYKEDINIMFNDLIVISKKFESFKNELNEYIDNKKDLKDFNFSDFFNSLKNVSSENHLAASIIRHLGRLLVFL
jgi:hypothetical protein